MRYEVRRHVLAELENLPGATWLTVADSGHEAAGAAELSGDAEASLLMQGGAPWRLEKTLRSMEDLMPSICQKTSRFFCSPLGAYLEREPLGTKLNGGKCFRRLLCFGFEVVYTSLPLGSK